MQSCRLKFMVFNISNCQVKKVISKWFRRGIWYIIEKGELEINVYAGANKTASHIIIKLVIAIRN